MSPLPPGREGSRCSGNRFCNLYDREEPGFLDFLKWQWRRLGKDIPPASSYHFPLAGNDPEFLQANRKKTTLTWIGHATVLLQLGGWNLLTDPIFSERASPLPWVGPRRTAPPGISLPKLPPIDLVLISHDHYDSLDRDTIRQLRNRQGGDETWFFVPMGLKRWFRRHGIERVVEMGWWDRQEAWGLEVIAVPMQHWSKRGLLRRNRTLWAGWVVLAGDFRFIFVGDTGYGPHFLDIGERLGPFDLAAIPIGAYEPRWFMRGHHLSPEGAAQAHLDLRSKKSIAIHWGTFVLTDEPLEEPPARLAAALAARRIPPEDFSVLRHGETISPR